MINRRETTEKLSRLVEKRLNNTASYWSSEVNFDKGMPNERRVDYVGFKPNTSYLTVEPTSVELGTFTFYEVKSGMQDFNSGHGLTFYGDKNFLVTTNEFAKELIEKWMVPKEIDEILVPDKSWTRLYTKVESDGTHRTRVSSEILWQMILAQNHQRRTSYEL